MTADLEVGVFGLRTFQIEETSGLILPVTPAFEWPDRRAYYRAWRGGKCVAECLVDPTHHPPEDGCTCGIYSFRDLGPLRRQYEQAEGLAAVVALEGVAVEGERGWRSQAARVVAMWAAPDILTPGLRRRVSRRVPKLRWFREIDDMTSTYIGTHAADDGPVAEDRYLLRKSIVATAPSQAWQNDSERLIALRILWSLLRR